MLARDVDGKLWGHCVHVGDAVPCCSFLNSLGGEEMGEEVDGIDPLRLTISVRSSSLMVMSRLA